MLPPLFIGPSRLPTSSGIVPFSQNTLRANGRARSRLHRPQGLFIGQLKEEFKSASCTPSHRPGLSEHSACFLLVPYHRFFCIIVLPSEIVKQVSEILVRITVFRVKSRKRNRQPAQKSWQICGRKLPGHDPDTPVAGNPEQLFSAGAGHPEPVFQGDDTPWQSCRNIYKKPAGQPERLRSVLSRFLYGL